MKKSILLTLSVLCPFFYGLSTSNSIRYYEMEEQPRPVVIVVNLPGNPSRPVLPPSSPKPTRLTGLAGQSNL